MQNQPPTFYFLAPVVLALLLYGPSPSQAQAPASDAVDESGQTTEPGEDRRVRRLGDAEQDEYQMDLSVPTASVGGDDGQQAYDLPDAEQNARLQQLLSALATHPGNAEALAQLDDFLETVLLEARQLGDQDRLQEMQQRLHVIQNVNPRKSGLKEAQQRLNQLRNVDEWLLSAETAIAEDRLLEPETNAALHFYHQVLSVDADNVVAEEGMRRIQQGLTERALQAARDLDFELAEEWLYEASVVREPQDLVEEARAEVVRYQARQADRLAQDIQKAINDQDFEYADFMLIDLIALVGNDARVQRLRDDLSAARVYGKYSPGQLIQDQFQGLSGSAPAVVVIKAGSFLMGSPESERGHEAQEEPQHRVTLSRGFALGLQEVTVGQFRRFIEDSGYRTGAENDGKSRVYDERSGRMMQKNRINWAFDYEGARAEDNLPVVHVSWFDAQAYVRWLSEKTGKRYRLPTEAEFEFAIRGGTVTAYWWGDDRPEQVVENLTGAEDKSTSGRQWSSGFRKYDDGFWGPAPGAIFPPNPLGLHDMAGNVSEWVEDCWHQNYVRAPADGSAWVNPGCERKVVRGGYWASAPEQARSAARISASASLHGPRVGIRIARDL